MSVAEFQERGLPKSRAARGSTLLRDSASIPCNFNEIESSFVKNLWKIEEECKFKANKSV